MVSSVDMNAHTLTLRRDGAVIGTFPVSTGKPGPTTETRSGVKTIIERDSVMVMDSATVGIPKGDPSYYKITTNWNLRLTWTGELIHSAPWSSAHRAARTCRTAVPTCHPPPRVDVQQLASG
jgi:lipoprotein-anchoring transpeptidase ErfK/SrfK